MAITREEALRQIHVEVEIENTGIDFSPELYSKLDYTKYQEQIRCLFDLNFKKLVDTRLPYGFSFNSTGFANRLLWNPNSEVKIVKEGEKFFLTKGKDGKDFNEEITFFERPSYYNQKTSDGKEMGRIAQARTPKGRIFIVYSNECSLKDKGLDCLFCNINDTKRRFEKVDKIEWKNPREIGETVAAAYEDGFHGFNLTGGFIPERREVEYYIDVIEAVKENFKGNDEDIHGMACVGAPQDLAVIDQYREAGYQHIATNMEVWDENLFKYICPGKEQFCGGRANWLKTLRHEVEVFGRGKVRSLFVGGLETKVSLLEGIETLSDLGVIACSEVWKPCIGSALEGHRSPKTEWHIDVLEKTYQIHKKNGFSLEDYYYTLNIDNPLAHLYMLDGQTLPWQKSTDNHTIYEDI